MCLFLFFILLQRSWRLQHSCFCFQNCVTFFSNLTKNTILFEVRHTLYRASRTQLLSTSFTSPWKSNISKFCFHKDVQRPSEIKKGLIHPSPEHDGYFILLTKYHKVTLWWIEYSKLQWILNLNVFSTGDFVNTNWIEFFIRLFLVLKHHFTFLLQNP